MNRIYLRFNSSGNNADIYEVFLGKRRLGTLLEWKDSFGFRYSAYFQNQSMITNDKEEAISYLINWNNHTHEAVSPESHQ
jgi:hypothetical protein